MILKDDFEQRLIEVDAYFEFLKKIENDDFRKIIKSDIHDSFYIDDELLKIFKANGFMILYNLIESTIFNSIISIFDEIKVDNIKFQSLTKEIQKFWLRHNYKYDPSITDEKVLYNKCYLIVQKVFEDITFNVSDKIKYGGSLDAKGIRSLAKELGVNLDEEHYKQETHGKALLTVKTNRNDLAHGKKSFSDIAKDITYNGITRTGADNEVIIDSLGLKHIKELSIEYLKEYIDSISVYINEKKYKIELN